MHKLYSIGSMITVAIMSSLTGSIPCRAEFPGYVSGGVEIIPTVSSADNDPMYTGLFGEIGYRHDQFCVSIMNTYFTYEEQHIDEFDSPRIIRRDIAMFTSLMNFGIHAQSNRAARLSPYFLFGMGVAVRSARSTAIGLDSTAYLFKRAFNFGAGVTLRLARSLHVIVQGRYLVIDRTRALPLLAALRYDF